MTNLEDINEIIEKVTNEIREEAIKWRKMKTQEEMLGVISHKAIKSCNKRDYVKIIEDMHHKAIEYCDNALIAKHHNDMESYKDNLKRSYYCELLAIHELGVFIDYYNDDLSYSMNILKESCKSIFNAWLEVL
jgi:hypothetical protein